MPETSKNTSVVVVGGGLAGLSAGAYLARAGLRPTIVERARELGGRAATHRRGDYLFNVGPHALYRGGPGVDVLRDLEVPYSGGVPQPAGDALYRGEFHVLPVSTGSLLRTGMLGVRAKFVFGRLLARLSRFDTSELRDLSVRQWLQMNVENEEAGRAAAAFLRLATYTNADEVFSAAIAVRQMQRALKNVIYVDDGWQSLVEKLRDRIVRDHGSIVTGARVVSLKKNPDGTYTVTRDDASVITASAVIVATEPREAGKLVQSATGRVPEGFGTVAPVRACVLDVGLDRLPNPDRAFVLGIDEPLYLSVHSRVARLAPDGGALIHTAKYLPPEETDPDQDRQQLEALLDRAQPGWRDVACEVQYLPRMKVATWLETPFTPRPEPRLADLPGVWFAGDWVRSDGWLADGSLDSARAIAPQIVEFVKWARAA